MVQHTGSILLSAIVAILLSGCDRAPDKPGATPEPQTATSPSTAEKRIRPVKPSPPIVAAARAQIGRTVTYDGAYVGLEYPMGDVPMDRGVCTDVVVRALRVAINADLQKLVHEDMKSDFSAYPKIWGLRKPDRNIDHRRVPNLMRFFERKGCSLAVSRNKQDYRPGDIVTCKVENLPHIMIVSDRKNSSGVPLSIHNIGRGTVEVDALFEFPITGHYRIARTARTN
ncbi:MAG: DUF1287 domain-containing protein [Phycisphaerae bacterium]|jgi:hypothetical protein|nr:DUF1287 domain-containing protein [Phycisphaerae bacterium]MDP7287315.1 DUF1287 domain-containing protein [Phycisphaerae bacterium]